MTFYTSGSCAHMDYERLGKNITQRLAIPADEAHTTRRSPVVLSFFRALVRAATFQRGRPLAPQLRPRPQGEAD